jgi:hypothetical protein
MIAISVAAVICGADDWVSIAAFARAKEAWLRKFLDLPNGIPSHDTVSHNTMMRLPWGLGPVSLPLRVRGGSERHREGDPSTAQRLYPLGVLEHAHP